MSHIIWYIIVGFIVGLIARAVMPGVQHLGFIMTTLLGIGGSIIGGLIGGLFSKPDQAPRFIQRESSCRLSARSFCFLSGENWRLPNERERRRFVTANLYGANFGT